VKRWLILLAACGHHDSAVAEHDAIIADDAGCTVPVLADAALASAAPSCTANNLPGSCIEASACIDTRTKTPGLCAGSAAIECCTPRFADDIACDPNAAPLPNACLAEEPGDPSCPAGMARVAAFCVDRFEASLASWSPYQNPTGHVMRAVSLRGGVPQAYISQLDASAACGAAGKRLCSDAEWLRACQGPTSSTYPYGDTREPGVCNDARAVHPAVELYGTSDAWIFSHLDSPCLDQEANGLAPTGSHAGCVSAEGAFDMMGNLHEWTADPAGTFRGGYYVDTVMNGNGCLYATTAHDTSYSDYSTGFRCCADPS
jgi:sulfatase modifying factor 1